MAAVLGSAAKAQNARIGAILHTVQAINSYMEHGGGSRGLQGAPNPNAPFPPSSCRRRLRSKHRHCEKGWGPTLLAPSTPEIHQLASV